MNFYLSAMRRYFDFSGRSSRSEFWFFVLFYFLLYLAAGLIDAALYASTGRVFGIATLLVVLAHIMPGLAVSVRRLHDTDRTGLWVLFFLLTPCVVLILALIAVGGSIIAMFSGGDEAFAAGIMSLGLALAVVALVNLVVWIVMIVFYATPGSPAANSYGPPPPV